MKAQYPIEKFSKLQTPFYYYDLDILRKTLQEVNKQIQKSDYIVHYAIKANANPALLHEIKDTGFGADCVSGGEINAAIKAGIPASNIVFAGVGKTDWEINLALDKDIFCFNVESIPELEVINQLAKAKGKITNIALRLNPNINPHTHHYITTGLEENKFGINLSDLDEVMNLLPKLKNLKLIGVHAHIGSQITDMSSFKSLCIRINEIQQYFFARRIILEHVNVGGGLGVNYEHPNHFPIPDFESYFNVFRQHLLLQPQQILHFELGRSIVAHCGSLISRVTFVKKGATKKFAILDAGFTDLIRPALYQAYHRIENLTSDLPEEEYDVVGPICESSDVFAKNYPMNQARRGDLIALRSAGAYGESMASQYNLRPLPKTYTSDQLLLEDN
ncbi:MAG TPA: diaminopimelate decarboxylase [Paludibacteraceae bacterium]|nr:diaminopimelate decarboxylase [Paludibacteraceae bacterium]HOL00609.1 diaminopimelate decarboxylase [Paludibacteraceae bacterium]HPO67264.1 diaminopimelate decarboxylase [Paludibacteraceae bacterium]HRR62729.1 diaminopimelate decarboxylase [Paludibacteraceae bacterium]HRU63247.1 diaminopimelate decarboxylase [Paludibacteraceae bacterium]